jgi:hypothetical protein
LPHSLQKPEGSHDVGLDEVFRAVDAAVHMAFSGEIDDRAGFVLGQQRVEHGAVTDIGLYKDVIGVAVQAGKGFQVACIGEFVDVDNRLTRLGQPVEYEVAADEAGAACDENHDA